VWIKSRVAFGDAADPMKLSETERKTAALANVVQNDPNAEPSTMTATNPSIAPTTPTITMSK